eukprot:jgi/Botrbrau1/1162/Bobra.0162s0050.1
MRYNRLTDVIRKSLVGLQAALKGQLLMSTELEAVGRAMWDGRVPFAWLAASYPSLKPLASYIADLLERLEMMRKWVGEGAPPVFWLSGFFFTHAFLTGVKQNFARRRKVPIDSVTLSHVWLTTEPAEIPPDGAVVRGLFLEGARFDAPASGLEESHPRILFSPAPLLHLLPRDARVPFEEETEYVACPLYRTAERRGTLATTGHSTNFVMDLVVPSRRSEEHWIRRGVAFLLSLSD